MLPRVRRALGMLKGLRPKSLLDVGRGRGVFLWPLLEQFPELEVTAIDTSVVRAHDLDAVARGGSVPEVAIRRMLERWQVPDITEARGWSGSCEIRILVLQVSDRGGPPIRSLRTK
jgi:hypothetical protein